MNRASCQIGDLLGVPAPATHAEALELVHRRLEIDVIQRLMDIGLERTEIGAQVIHLRTLQSRRTRGERLTVKESDRVLSLLRALSLAAEVYGSMERALAWLRRKNPRLSGHVPLSILQTWAGSRLVEELLFQIDEGMYI
jgi:putative toxin-antitoxin system antitoxin component (TIGR02293 family)